MELTVRVQALVTELQLADGVLEREQSDSDLVHLEVVGDSLQFTSRGNSLWLQTSCPVEVISGGAIAVPMRRLLAYLQLLPGDAELRIATTEADMAQVTLARATTRVPGLSGESFDIKLESNSGNEESSSESLPEPRLELPAKLLLEALNRTIISVAEEQSHYTIEGAQLIVQRDKMGMVSTDGHRLSLYLQEASVGALQEGVRCLIGRKAMIELKRILEQCESSEDELAKVEFAEDETKIYFRTPRRFLVSQRLAGRFPDYNRVMPKEFNATLELDKEVLAPVLRRVSLVSERRSHGVRFDIENGEMKLQAQVFGDDADMLHSEESVSVDYEGDPIRVGFNVRYILDFLQICTNNTFRLHIGDPRSAALMEIASAEPGTDYRYVLMPIRV